MQYDFPVEWTSEGDFEFSRDRRAPDPLSEWAYMLVYDLSGHYNVNLSGTADISPQAEDAWGFSFFYFPKRIQKRDEFKKHTT